METLPKFASYSLRFTSSKLDEQVQPSFSFVPPGYDFLPVRQEEPIKDCQHSSNCQALHQEDFLWNSGHWVKAGTEIGKKQKLSSAEVSSAGHRTGVAWRSIDEFFARRPHLLQGENFG